MDIINELNINNKLNIFINDINLLYDLNNLNINIAGTVFLYTNTYISLYINKNIKIKCLNKLPENQEFDIIIINSIFILNKLKTLNNQFKYIISDTIIDELDSFLKYKNFNIYQNIAPVICNDSKLINSDIILNTNKKIILPDIRDYKTYQPNVYIIIPIYNQANYTKQLLLSINKYKEPEFNVYCILIDNGSNKENQNIVNQCLLECNNINYHIINFDKPIGFVKASNAGIKYALEHNADYICLQNNDTEVTKNWMSLLIKDIKNNIIGTCPITNSSEAIQGFKHVSKINLINVPSNILTLQTDKISDFVQTNYLNKKILISWKSRPFTPAFFCTMFRADIFKYFLLDECFGKGYADDVDYCFRIMQYGFNFLFIPACYIPHYHHITFNSENDKQQLVLLRKARVKQALLINELNPLEQKIGIIYTANIGNYDTFLHHKIYDINNFDYVYFTLSSNPYKMPYPWKTVYLDDFLPFIDLNDKNDTIRLARWAKTHPHIFFRNYQISIWIDSNTSFITDPINLINNIQFDYLLTQQHPSRNCIYKECQECINLKKDNTSIITKELEFLKQENYPENNGLAQTNILVRKHNNLNCIKYMEEWWNMIKKYSRRDQLSFNYIAWKFNLTINLLSYNEMNTKYIHWKGIH